MSNNLPAVIAFFPVNDVPDKAPKPPMDLANPNLSFDDVLPSNYFSLESLQIWLEERSAESRVLTVEGCSVEFVYDPEKGIETGSWKPCLSFDDTSTMLVINKSRGEMLKRLARSPLLADWAKVGQVAIKPGIANGKAQIVITAVPGENGNTDTGRTKKAEDGRNVDEVVSEVNDSLFG